VFHAPPELCVSDGRIEPGREFQVVGAGARKEREPKMRLLRLRSSVCKISV